jgi:hypothetical protein
MANYDGCHAERHSATDVDREGATVVLRTRGTLGQHSDISCPGGFPSISRVCGDRCLAEPSQCDVWHNCNGVCIATTMTGQLSAILSKMKLLARAGSDARDGVLRGLL